MGYWNYKRKHCIYNVKRWLIHKLGGYMPNECVVDPNKVKHLKLTRHYSIDCMAYRRDYNAGALRAKAVKEFAESLITYIKSEVMEDEYTNEYVIRTSIRVVDDRR